MTPSQKYLAKLGLKDPEPIEVESTGKQITTSPTETSSFNESENPRRSFLKKSALGGIALGSAFMFSPIEEVIAQSTQKVSRFGAPSDLKIQICVIVQQPYLDAPLLFVLIPTRVFMAWVKLETVLMNAMR